MAVLEFIQDGQAFSYALSEGETIIGRGTECHLQLSSKAVSGRHARILKRRGDFLLEDLASRNGTWINARQVTSPVLLRNADRLKLGDVLLCFVDEYGVAVPMSTGLDDATAITTAVRSAGRYGRFEVQPEAKLKAVLEISTRLAGTVDLKSLLPKIVDTLLQIFPHADRACILLIDETSGSMVSRAMNNRGHDPGTAVQLSRTIVGKVLNEKKGILSTDASTDTQFASSNTIVDLSIRSMMCAPMLGLDGAPLGIIYMDCQIMGNPFTKEDLDLLMAVAGQAALSYENARLVASYIEKQKQDNELSIARTVQHALLPNTFPEVDGYQFYASYDSARAIGGDYYDCFMLDDEKVVLTVGDVAGKGVPGALLMTWLSSCVQSTLRFVTDVERAFRTINEYTCNNTVGGRFVTFVLIVIDLKTHQLALMNAGHLSPLIRRENGGVETFGDDAVGPPIGIIEDHPYEVDRRLFHPGDTFVIITDGVYEALNDAGELYGTERVVSLMQEGKSTAEELAKALLADVRKHAEGQAQNDDITIVAISRAPDR